MAWIESHTILLKHRKLKGMARELRLKPVYLLGHLHALWHAALEQQEDGDLSSWTDEMIAELSEFPGDAPQYVSLLHKYRWLEDKKIHDWLDYVGRYLDAKYRTSNPARLKAIKEKHVTAIKSLPYDKKRAFSHDYSQTKDRLKTDLSPPIVGPPNLTEPNQKIKDQPKPPADFSKEFVDKAKIAEDQGFNIYKLLGRAVKSGLSSRVPEIVLSAVLDEFLNRRDSGRIKNHWPYFMRVLKEKSREYFAEIHEKEHEKLKEEFKKSGPVLLSTVLARGSV